MKRTRLPVLLPAMIALLAPTVAHAQSTAINVTVTPVTIAFPTPGVADFDAGYVQQSGVTVSVRPKSQGRKGQSLQWQLLIRSDMADMGGYGKPIGDILWQPAGSSTWTPLSTSDQVIVSGQGSQDVVIYFRLKLSWVLDAPNTYSAPVVFTVQ